MVFSLECADKAEARELPREIKGPTDIGTERIHWLTQTRLHGRRRAIASFRKRDQPIEQEVGTRQAASNPIGVGIGWNLGQFFFEVNEPEKSRGLT